jgi:hypothetical protein
MKSLVFDNIKNFQKTNEKFMVGFENQNVCLRQFDESLSNKCNKHSFMTALEEQ